MRYTDEQIKALRDRWDKPLLKPGSFKRDEEGRVFGGERIILNEGIWSYHETTEKIGTFEQILVKRLKGIEDLVTPQLKKTGNIPWQFKREL